MTSTVVCAVDHSPTAHSVVEAAAALAEAIDAQLLLGTRADRRLGALAGSLASGLGSRLRVAHVLAPLPDAGLALPGAPVVVSDPPAVPRSPEAVALLREVLDDILAEHPELDGRADWCLRSGDAGTQLAELGASSHAAAIVVGTCGRGAMRSALTRSPAAKLARAATVPVVISRDGTR